MKKTYESKIEELNKIISNNNNRLNENMKGMNDQMNKLRRDFEREKEALMSKHREELERIKFQNSLSMTETKNNYESRISELNLKINQLQETLDNIKSNNSSLLESTKKKIC